MSMSDQWFSKCRYTRRDFVGMDSLTHQPMYGEIVVLDDEPCDIFNKRERQAQQGSSGTIYNTVVVPFLKIFPPSIADLPDQNDYIHVDGAQYRVLEREDFWDGGSGDYHGSRVRLQRTNVDNSPSLGPSISEGATTPSADPLTVT